MKEILVDIETYSEVDIGKCGLYRYAADPSFEILLVAWATDEGDGFGETRCADLASGEVIPDELLEAFQTGSVRLIAHNAAFERVCFSVYLNRHCPRQYLKPGDFLSPDSWICTMVMAASLTLPLALKDVGTVLKTSQQKDKEGERLIKLFSVPCKPTKSNGMRTRNLPEHYPADWAKFKYYCIQDVNTEIDIYKRLKKFPMTELEWQHYRTNERINDRGVRIDTELVQEAITCDLMLSDAMSKKAYELTGLENPNSVSQLKTWLEERGIPMDTLGKKDVAQMITELDKNGVDAEALDMLKLRLQMAKSSVKKYQAAERCVCPDGRARGLFQFYGASRTGRYSGRNIQLQNLPQNHISTLDEARTLNDMGERRHHVGRQAKAVEDSFTLYSDETMEAEDKAFLLKLRDTTMAAIDEARFSQVVGRLQESMAVPITGKVQDVVQLTAQSYGINAEEQEGILKYLIEGGDLSLYGLSNAVTRISQDVVSYDRATALEGIGWQVATMEPQQWKQINQ